MENKSTLKNKNKFTIWVIITYSLVLVGIIIFSLFFSGAFIKLSKGARGTVNFIEYTGYTLTLDDVNYQIIDEENKTIALTSKKNSCSITNYKIPSTLTIDETEYSVVEVRGTSLAVPFDEDVRSVEFSNGNLTIGDYAFSSCDKLMGVNISESVENISNFAFFNSTNIEHFIVSPENETFSTKDNGRILLQENNKILFLGHDFRKLSTITIPTDVTKIGAYVFKDCTSLKEVILNENITEIGTSAFEDCTNLRSINLGDTKITKLSSKVLKNCNVSSIILPTTLTTIEDNTLYGNKSLTSLTTPFIGANKIDDQTQTSVLGYFFGTTSYTGGVDIQQIYAYDTENETDLTNTYYIPETLQTVTVNDANFIPCGALSNLVNVKNINIENTPIIRYKAFYNDTGITSMDLTGELVTIWNNAFENCTNLKIVNLGDKVNDIYENAFLNCTSLKTVVFNSVNATKAANASSLLLEYATVAYTKTYIGNGYLTTWGYSVGASLMEGYGQFEKKMYYPYYYTIANSVLDYTSINGIKWTFTYDYDINEDNESITINRCRIVAEGNGVKTNVTEYNIASCYKIDEDKSDDIPGVVYITTAIEGTLSEDANVYIPIDSNIVNIALPYTLKKIGKGAFYGSDLTSITIQEGVEVIDDYAFYNCANLTSITLPSTLKSIGKLAFAGTGLTSITIPENVEFIGNGAFANNNLNSFIVETDNFSALLEGKILNDGNKLLGYAMNGVTDLDSIPSDIEVIGDYAFYNTVNLESITLPNTIQQINNYAFAGCTCLDNINLSSSLTTICEYAFFGCIGIESITLPDSLQTIHDFAFSETHLSSITIPSSVEEIGDGVFLTETLDTITVEEGNVNYEALDSGNILVSVEDKRLIVFAPLSIENYTIPTDVEIIGSHSFDKATGLKLITITENIKNIEEDVFKNCNFLNTVYIHSSQLTIYRIIYSNLINSEKTKIIYIQNDLDLNTEEYFQSYYYVLPVTTQEGYKTYENNIYYPLSFTFEQKTYDTISDVYESNLYNITLSLGYSINEDNESVTINKKYLYDESGYEHNDYLRRYNIASHYEMNGVVYKVTAIEGTLDNETYIPFDEYVREIALPYTLKKIGKGAFYGSSLASITIPEGVEVIDDYAFYHCTNLTSITLPTTLTTIGKHAFDGCSNLASITIQEGVEVIDDYAFYNCTNLTSITLPTTITTIGNFALAGTALTSIVIPINVENIGYGALGIASLRGITVEEGNADFETLNDGKLLIKNAELIAVAYYFYSFYTIPEGITSIGAYAYYNSRNSLIIISENIVSISENAFNNSSMHYFKIDSSDVANSNTSMEEILEHASYDIYIKDAITEISSLITEWGTLQDTSTISGYNQYNKNS